MMSDTPKRIWAAQGAATGATMWWPDNAAGVGTEYHRADLSADLVRAGYLAGLEVAANKMCHPSNLNDLGGYGSPMRAAKGDRDAILAMSPNERAIAAIVAQVMEGGE